MREYKQAILSLCDHSGAWSKPFIDMGYVVIRVDPKHGDGFNHGGTGYSQSGGDGYMRHMPDGGYSLAMTAGDLADALESEGTYCLDYMLHCLRQNTGTGHGINPVQDDPDMYAGIEIVGTLIAAPCTDFANSGARWFKDKDANGSTEQSIQIVRDCLRVVEASGTEWWCLENPNGRIQRCVPELGKWLMKFDPCDYAGFADDPDKESYTKLTMLYGEFNTALPTAPREPVYYYKTKKDGTVMRGSWMWANLGGKSERTKELRSVTPLGFARAFAEANG